MEEEQRGRRDSTILSNEKTFSGHKNYRGTDAMSLEYVQFADAPEIREIV